MREGASVDKASHVELERTEMQLYTIFLEPPYLTLLFKYRDNADFVGRLCSTATPT
jgi:hypothetical protein